MGGTCDGTGVTVTIKLNAGEFGTFLGASASVGALPTSRTLAACQ